MPPEYLISRALAAKKLGISERRLLELAAKGDLHREFIRDPRGQKTSVFAAVEIEHYLAERQGKPISSPQEPPNGTQTYSAAVPQSGRTAAMPQGVLAPPQTMPLWLTLAQAAEYSGLPAAYLRQRIKGGSLRALNVGAKTKGGRWRVSRKALQAIEGTLQIEGVVGGDRP